MKKILVIALAIVLTLGVLAFAACEEPQTVTGECKYENAWVEGAYYGAKVDVTVKGNTITAVKLYTDAETGWTRTTNSWTAEGGGLGYEATEAAYENWLTKTFVGKTVAEVNAYVATATQAEQSVGTDSAKLEGATQSSARIICAVQNALSKLSK